MSTPTTQHPEYVGAFPNVIEDLPLYGDGITGHPSDAAGQYLRRTLATRHLIDHLAHAYDEHGEWWYREGDVDLTASEPSQFLLAMIVELETCGRQLVEVVRDWHADEVGRAITRLGPELSTTSMVGLLTSCGPVRMP